MWNPGIRAEPKVVKSNRILLAANVEPARIIPDCHAKSRPPERMDANMRKVRVRMQEEDVGTDATASTSTVDTATNAQAKSAYFLSLGLMTATTRLLRGRCKKRRLAAEYDDVNNNEVGAAAIEPPKRLKVEDEHAPIAIPAGYLTSGEPGSENLKWTTSYPRRWQNPPPLADLSEPSHPFHEVWQKWNPSHKPDVKEDVDVDDDEDDELTDQEDAKNATVQIEVIDLT